MLDASTSIPVIIYVDDIKVSEENTPLGTAIDLNPYLLKNGKHKIKLQIFPVFRLGDNLVSPEDISSCRLIFGSYIRENQNGDIKDYNANFPLTLKIPTQAVPFFEQEWEVEVKNLPYELEGWSKGQDLRKLDQNQLEHKVVEYYKNLWNILNNGEGEKYISLWEKADSELIEYDYEYKLNELNNDEIEKIKKYCKNNIIPLDDYEMKIYGDGKLVSLERKNHTMSFNNKSPLDIKGWSPLIRKGQKAGASNYRVKLYLPEGSNEFVIIRK